MANICSANSGSSWRKAHMQIIQTQKWLAFRRLFIYPSVTDFVLCPHDRNILKDTLK